MKKIIKKILPDSVAQFIKKQIKKKAKNEFDLNNYYLLPKSKLTYAQDWLYTYHNSDFMKEPHFVESYEKGKLADGGQFLTNIDIHWRVYVACWAAKHASNLQGDFVECGVNKGILSSAVINYVEFQKLNKKFYLLDTFSGLDEKYCTQIEMEKSKSSSYEKQQGLYEQVIERFNNFNVKIIKGAIPETLNEVDTKMVCYLSIDMNCVQPEVEALNFFWEKIVSGGIIILDDYGYANSYNEQKKAHDAFAKSKGVMVLTLPTGQGLILKP